MSGVPFIGDRRREAVFLLAGSVFDWGWWLFNPAMTRLGGRSGPVARRLKPCPVCTTPPRHRRTVTPGRVVDKFGRSTPCTTCGGRLERRDPDGKLRVRAKKGKGRVPVDDYTGQIVATMRSVTDAAPRTVRCDSCDGQGAYGNGRRCEHCDGSGRRVLPLVHQPERDPSGADPLDAYADAIQRRNQEGDYVPFERAHALLHDHDVGAYNTFTAVMVFGYDESRLTRHEQDRLGRAVEFMLARMPNPIRVPAQVVAADKARQARRVPVSRLADPRAIRARDEDMRSRYEAGEVSQQELVRETGLHRSTVSKIVNGG